jgi:hypothetical protein
MTARLFALWLLRTLRDAGWAPASVFGIHVLASRVFGIYARFPNFDVVMHLLGGAAIAYFLHVMALHGSQCRVLGPYHRRSHVLLIFAWTCTAAVFWEFAEWLSDRYLGSHAQMGDLDDTLKDILMGMVGGTLFLGIFVAIGRIPREKDEASLQPRE